MPVYDFYRKYRIEAANPTQGFKKMLDALDAKQDEAYHVSDSIREADESAATDKSSGWANSLKRQVLGK